MSKKRTCLRCGNSFSSLGIANRICNKCNKVNSGMSDRATAVSANIDDLPTSFKDSLREDFNLEDFGALM